MIPIENTGAVRAVTDLIRLKTAEQGEFLLSKGYIIGHDAAGEELSHYLPWPEMWIKTLFSWNNEYNVNTKQFEKMCLGPSGTETVYMLEFNTKNAKELFDQRGNDIQINFILKDEISNEVRMVEKDVNSQKTFIRVPLVKRVYSGASSPGIEARGRCKRLHKGRQFRLSASSTAI